MKKDVQFYQYIVYKLKEKKLHLNGVLKTNTQHQSHSTVYNVPKNGMVVRGAKLHL